MIKILLGQRVKGSIIYIKNSRETTHATQIIDPLIRNGLLYNRAYLFFDIYRCFVFMKNLVIFRHGHAKNYRRNVFEAMNPFFSLRSLTTDVKQSIENRKLNFFLLQSKLNVKSITHLKFRFLNEKCTSTIPVVFTLVRSISCSVGW